MTVAQYTADLLSFLKKYKMAAAAIMNCYLVTLDNPRSMPEVCVKISRQSR